MDITTLPISLIDEDKDQPRYQFNEEALQELANSISEIGLLSPIKVLKQDNNRYKIIYGNRRYKASVMIGLETIPCIISQAQNEMDVYFEQIAENLTREDFSPIEEAEAFHKLLNDDKFRSSMKLLSSKLGKSESYIKNKCELLKFSSAVKKLIVSGTQIRKDCLTEDQLMPLKDLPMEYRDTLALTAARDELPVSDVKKIAKLFKDKTISDSTKEKLLLKNGSGLIETWSVFEQNRKEKLAREKERAEQAKLAAEREEARKEQQSIVVEATELRHTEQDVQPALNRAATNDESFSEKHHENAVALVSTQTKPYILPELNADVFIGRINQLQQQTTELMEQIKTGQIKDYEAVDQLYNEMNIQLQQLSNSWKWIHQQIN